LNVGCKDIILGNSCLKLSQASLVSSNKVENHNYSWIFPLLVARKTRTKEIGGYDSMREGG
jgi:hypothetical protein